MNNGIVLPTYKVCILGTSGFIGGSLQECLLTKSDLDVIGFSSKDCDLLDYEQVQNCFKNLNSNTSVIFTSFIGPKLENTIHSLRKNVQMVTNFALQVHEKNLRSVIFLSSTDIYGMPPKQLPITEETPPNIIEFYGLAKFASEKILSFELAERCPLTILRLPGIYGSQDRGSSIIGKFSRQTAEDKRFTLTNKGRALRDYVEIADLCKVIQHFLEKPHAGIINVATGRSIPVETVVSLIAKALGKEPRMELTDECTIRDHDLMFDTAKLLRLCPDTKMLSVESGIQTYVNSLNAASM